MIQKIIIRFLRMRHPWRELSFSQLAELYSAISLRQFAQNLVGLFIPVYLYKIGFALPDVLLFFVIAYGTAALASFPVGYLVARIGPKHTLLASNLGQIAALVLLVTLPNHHWPLALPAMIYGLAIELYFLPYHVDFSKILHPEHGGKELGFMMNLRTFGALVAPLVGGLIAFVWDARYTLAVGIALFALAAVPLFASGEPVVKHQKLDFHGLLKKERWPDYLSFFGYSANLKVGILLWPLFITITIFSSGTYAKIGLVTSIGAIAALLTTMLIGRLVDNDQGKFLLKASAFVAAALHFLRTTITGLGGVIAVNLIGMGNASGYGIAYIRGFYDQADSLPGQRIAYVTMMELASELGNVGIALAAYGLSLFLLPGLALKASFIVGSGFALLMLTQRFPALAPHQSPLRLLANMYTK